MVDSQIALAFEPYLNRAERLTWTGRPRQGLMFGPMDIFMVPFSLLWAGGAFFIIGTAVLSGELAGPFLIIGPLFVIVGVYFVIGRFLLDAWVRSRTVYGLTGERALLLRRAFGEDFVATRTGGTVRLSRGANGRGSIEFGTGGGLFSGFSGFRQGLAMWHPSLASEVRFLGIDNVGEVYRLASGGR